MALIVETGAGVTGANGYIDTSFLDSWAANRAYDLTAYDTAAKEAAIIIASNDWVDLNHTFKGERLTEAQGLKMPTDATVYDDKWRSVVAMAAYMQLRGLLLVDTATLSTAGVIESESSSLDVLSESITYAKGTSQTYSRITTDLDRAIMPYLSISTGFGSMVRW